MIEEAQEKYSEILEYLKRLRDMEPSFSKGEIFSTMITKPHPIVVEAFKIFIDTNLNDPILFKQIHKLEGEVIEFFSKYFNSKTPSGFITTGGSESNITALYILRETTDKRKVIVPISAHVSIFKACKILGLKPVTVDLDENYMPRIDEIERNLKQNQDIAAIVLTVGTTDLGLIEPVDEVSKICGEHNVPIHVDAAFGGIIAQTLIKLGYKLPRFDFTVESVATMTIDPHKLFAPIPGGIILFKNQELRKPLTFTAPYMPLGKQTTLLGTRTGGSAAAIWTAIKLLGEKGLRKLVLRLMELTSYLAKRLEEEGLTLIVKPQLPIIAVKVKNRERVLEELWKRKIYVSPSTIPEIIRIVIEPHITKQHIDKLIENLVKVTKRQ